MSRETSRISLDSDQDLARLVLGIIDFLRQLLERQASRRTDLTIEEAERVGAALQKLEERMYEMAEHFGLDPEDLSVDLGPLGKLA